MASSRWEPTAVKAQLKLTSQRLGQLQEKMDSKGNITRRDTATLLQQGNIALARAKAQNLIQQDAMGQLLEVLKMHVCLILENFNEFDQKVSPSPTVVEAASSIIFAAPHAESKDLNAARDFLVQRLGPDFSRSAVVNRDNHVSSKVIHAISTRPPSAANLDAYLMDIAKTYGVKWAPERRRQDTLNSLSEILDPEFSPTVDLPRLRKLCSYGIPDEPAWLRPRIWKLLFGILSVSKASWKSEMSKQRESYYDLIRRILGLFSNLPPPTVPLAALDSSLLSVSKLLGRVPPYLFSGLEGSPEFSSLCPMDNMAFDDIKIVCANNLDLRLRAIQDRNSERSEDPITPEIRLEPDNDGTPEISLSAPESFSSHRQNTPTTLLPSKTYHAGNANQKHSSALLRLLYLHSSINPGNHSPHLPSLLVTLYSVFVQEIEPHDLAHVEADTFWLFEAMVGEFSELEDEEGGNLWMKKFSERLAWADGDLWACLQAKGLDPALPHYSYRWLAPLLTQTLPLSSVLLVWDTLFSCPMRERVTNPKLEHLLNICTSMLIRARTTLFRLGKSNQKSTGLWAEENDGIPLLSPSHAWELSDAFLEGMSLLQLYPVEAAGGIDRLLQTASDLAQRRQEEAKTQMGDNLSLGARLKVTMWKGFTNQTSSPDSPVEEEAPSEPDLLPDDGNDTETPQNTSSLGLTSRLATTVWRGITNQTSMEPPPSPLTPISPAMSRSPSPLPSVNSNEDPILQTSPPLQAPSSIWSYAEKLKDSDTAATLAKVSSNWRAKALLGTWNVRGRASSTPDLLGYSPGSPTQKQPGGPESKFDEARRDSLSSNDHTGLYSPPRRPVYFHPPRDSIVVLPEGGLNVSSSPEMSPPSDNGVLKRTKNLQASLASLTRSHTPQPAPKAGPRPLLLGSSSLITTSQANPRSRSASSTPVPEGQWTDVMRAKVHNVHRGSQSSISSLSPSDALTRPLKSRASDWDSDTAGPSRVVPLNRRSVSPMAPSFRVPHVHGRPTSGGSSSSDRGILSPPLVSRHTPSDSMVQNSDNIDSHGWGRISLPDSPPIASPPPRTPTIFPSHDGWVRVTDSEPQRGSMVLSDPNGSPLEPSQSKKPVRKNTPPPTQYQTEDTSDSSVSQAPSISPRIRSKRPPSRLAHLRIQDHSRSRGPTEQKQTNANSLGVDWPVEDVVLTPRATSFDVDGSSASSVSPRSPRRSRKVSTDGSERVRKISTDGHEARGRKISTGSRTRKVSTENKEISRKSRDSGAEEGDDEGYDDLLSAYESEGSMMSAF